MAIDKAVDSAQLEADLTSVANAIRTKGGTTGQLSFPDGMAAAVAAIQSSGPRMTFPCKGELSQTVAAHPFVPAYQNEMVLWIIEGSHAPTSGSVSVSAFCVLIIDGAPTAPVFWIAGNSKTVPWTVPLRCEVRQDAISSFGINESGQLTVTTGTWAFLNGNNAMSLYEIPLNLPESSSQEATE